MSKKYIKIAISSIAGLLLTGVVVYVVFSLTHKQEKEEKELPTAAMEQTILEVHTLVLR